MAGECLKKLTRLSAIVRVIVRVGVGVGGER